MPFPTTITSSLYHPLDTPKLDSKTIVFYHDDCTDGLAAATIVREACNADDLPIFHPAAFHHLDPAAKVAAICQGAGMGEGPDRVIFLDMAPEPVQVGALIAAYPRAAIWIYDHHKSAIEDYAARAADTEIHTLRAQHRGEHEIKLLRLAGGSVLFAACQTLSGAQIAYYLLARNSVFMETTKGVPPWWIDYVGDRDLWKHELPESKAINAAIWNATRCIGANDERKLDVIERFAGELTRMVAFGAFLEPIFYDVSATPDKPAPMMPKLHQNTFLHGVIQMGHFVRNAVQLAAEEVAKSAFVIDMAPAFGCYTVHYTACPRFVRSEVGALLNEWHHNPAKPSLAVLWHQDTPTTVQVSLRSKPGTDVDVSAIAVEHGGGGHKHAAGFVTSPDRLLGLLFGATVYMRAHEDEA